MSTRAFLAAAALPCVALFALSPIWSQPPGQPQGQPSQPGQKIQQQGQQERHDFSKVDDQQFAQMAEQINLTEIAAGNEAMKKGKRGEVQQFGKMMVDEHTKANQKLAAAVQNKNITGKLDQKHQAKVDKLSGLSGDDFDRAYIQEMVQGHNMAAQLLEHEATRGQDNNLKNYAAEILPHVRGHQQRAQQIWTTAFQNNR